MFYLAPLANERGHANAITLYPLSLSLSFVAVSSNRTRAI